MASRRQRAFFGGGGNSPPSLNEVIYSSLLRHSEVEAEGRCIAARPPRNGSPSELTNGGELNSAYAVGMAT